MRQLMLVIIGAVWMQNALWAGADKPVVVLRLHLQNLDATDTAQVVPLPLRDPEQLIYVNKFAFLSEKYLHSARQLADGYVLVQFDNIGATALETTTSANLGKIMVVIFNGRIILAAIIDQPLREGRLLLPGITPEEFKQLELLIKKQRSN
jgi:preprotein translocase subunit SecD